MMNEQELRQFGLQDLQKQARKLGIVGSSLMSKEELIKNILDLYLASR